MTIQTLNTQGTNSLKNPTIVRNLLSFITFVVSACLVIIGSGCSEKSPVAPDAAPPARVSSVEIQNAPVSMLPGTVAFLNAMVEADEEIENRNVVWSSSAPGILRVNNQGKISALAPGTAEVTARAAADDKIKDLVRVVVASSAPTVGDVVIEPITEEFYFGNTLTLSANVTGTGAFDPSVAWRSNRPHVASVNAQGVVTAEAPGNIEITAESKADPTKSTQILLEVLPARIEAIALHASQMEMRPGNTQTLDSNVTSLGQIDTSVRWASSNNAIATVANGVVSARTSGDVIIEAVSNADPSQRASVRLNVKSEFVWTRMPGQGRDVAVGADGTVFAIGGFHQGTGNYQIMKWNVQGHRWDALPGAAIRVAVDPNGNPWVVNTNHDIYYHNGTNWSHVPGKATDIAVGANGSVFVIGNPSNDPAGSAIYKRVGNRWQEIGGRATRISVDRHGNPWVTNRVNDIYYHNGTNWSHIPGKATDIAAGADGSVWTVQVNTVLARWNGSSFAPDHGTSAKSVAVGPQGQNWHTNSSNNIWAQY